MTDSFDHIESYYGLPFRVGSRVRYDDGPNGTLEGTVVGTAGPYIKVKVDGEERCGLYHPTWNIELLEGE